MSSARRGWPGGPDRRRRRFARAELGFGARRLPGCRRCRRSLLALRGVEAHGSRRLTPLATGRARRLLDGARDRHIVRPSAHAEPGLGDLIGLGQPTHGEYAGRSKPQHEHQARHVARVAGATRELALDDFRIRRFVVVHEGQAARAARFAFREFAFIALAKKLGRVIEIVARRMLYIVQGCCPLVLTLATATSRTQFD